MNILLIDFDQDGLAWVIRCQEAGHKVRVWFPKKSQVGEGLVTKITTWQGSMKWADLIVLTGNAMLGGALEYYYQQNYPIIGSNKASAKLELDRAKGQVAFERCGVETLPYEVFSDYGKAIQFVKANKDRAFVVKPWGGTADKALSYVPPKGYETEALEFKLNRWKQEGLKGEFILQECVRGTEMGVSGWFGPGGFNKWIEEDWEEKKFMNGGLGRNTGEQGTIVRHVKESLLFDRVLKPLEPLLHEMDFCGNINVNCGIDGTGHPWPYELTMRLGWPDFNIIQPLVKGDPAEWMLDLYDGKDSLEMSEQVGIGVVMTHGDYPCNDLFNPASIGYPIYGLEKVDSKQVQLGMVRAGRERLETAGEYAMVVTAQGDTVSEAMAEVYKSCGKIKWSNNYQYRTDIGARLEKELPKLQRHGYAKDMLFW